MLLIVKLISGTYVMSAAEGIVPGATRLRAQRRVDKLSASAVCVFWRNQISIDEFKPTNESEMQLVCWRFFYFFSTPFFKYFVMLSLFCQFSRLKVLAGPQRLFQIAAERQRTIFQRSCFF